MANDIRNGRIDHTNHDNEIFGKEGYGETPNPVATRGGRGPGDLRKRRPEVCATPGLDAGRRAGEDEGPVTVVLQSLPCFMRHRPVETTGSVSVSAPTVTAGRMRSDRPSDSFAWGNCASRASGWTL